MTVPFDESHSVWTDNHDQAWIDRNDTSDMMLVPYLSIGHARELCARLRLITPDLKLWINNVFGDTVDTFETRGPLASSARETKRA
jgi:hypothetical protein